MLLSGSLTIFLSIGVFITTKSATRKLAVLRRSQGPEVPQLGTGDMQMSSKKKVLAIAITTVALTAGTFGTASATSKSTKVTRTSVSTIANQSSTGKISRGQELTTILSALVAKGTITQAQADAITAAHAAAEAAHEAERAAMGPQGGVKVTFDQKLTVISSVLGIDTTTIVNRVKAGETLATIAGTKTSALIAALVADETKRIDAAVTAGTLTAAQATTLKSNLVAHVTAEVNSPAPIGGPRGDKGEMKGGKGGRGHGGPKGGMSGAPTIPAPTTTTSSN